MGKRNSDFTKGHYYRFTDKGLVVHEIIQTPNCVIEIVNGVKKEFKLDGYELLGLSETVNGAINMYILIKKGDIQFTNRLLKEQFRYIANRINACLKAYGFKAKHNLQHYFGSLLKW